MSEQQILRRSSPCRSSAGRLAGEAQHLVIVPIFRYYHETIYVAKC